MQRLRLAVFRALRGRGWSKLPGGRKLIAAARGWTRSSEAIVHGFRMELDPNDSLGLAFHGEHEPFETDLVKMRVKTGDTVLDLGAHIGYYTLLFSKIVERPGRVYSFEPTPDTFDILRRNIERNQIQNVRLINAAVSDRKGTAALFLNSENIGDNHVFDTGASSSLTVPTIAIDDLDIPSVQFVKMDIQGAEPRALVGMERTLRRSRSTHMLIEFWPLGMRRAGSDPGEFLDRLKAMGFVYRHVDRDAKALVSQPPDFFLNTEWIVQKSTDIWCEKR